MIAEPLPRAGAEEPLPRYAGAIAADAGASPAARQTPHPSDAGFGRLPRSGQPDPQGGRAGFEPPDDSRATSRPMSRSNTRSGHLSRSGRPCGHLSAPCRTSAPLSACYRQSRYLSALETGNDTEPDSRNDTRASAKTVHRLVAPGAASERSYKNDAGKARLSEDCARPPGTCSGPVPRLAFLQKKVEEVGHLWGTVRGLSRPAGRRVPSVRGHSWGTPGALSRAWCPPGTRLQKRVIEVGTVRHLSGDCAWTVPGGLPCTAYKSRSEKPRIGRMSGESWPSPGGVPRRAGAPPQAAGAPAPRRSRYGQPYRMIRQPRRTSRTARWMIRPASRSIVTEPLPRPDAGHHRRGTILQPDRTPCAAVPSRRDHVRPAPPAAPRHHRACRSTGGIIVEPLPRREATP